MSIKFLFPPTSREKLTPSIPFLALLHKFHREDGTTFLSISSLSFAIICCCNATQKAQQQQSVNPNKA